MSETKRLAELENSLPSDKKVLYKKIVEEATRKVEKTRYHSTTYKEYFCQIRYMLSIGYQTAMMSLQNEILFIGGMGVLGNLLSYLEKQGRLGEESILSWRGTPDLDMLFKQRHAVASIHMAFDKLMQAPTTKSLSIPNKLSLSGYCFDPLTNSQLDEAKMDICVPDTSNRNQIKLGIAEMVITEEDWRNKKSVSLFGIQLNFLSCIPLLNSKLTGEEGQPLRMQDLEDIAHLLAIAEKEGISPATLADKLLPKAQRRCLEAFPDLRKISPTALFLSSKASYRDEILASALSKLRRK